MVYASSALAGRSLSRAYFCYILDIHSDFTTPILLITGNLMGTAYPLSTTPLYRNLTFRWGGTLIACVAAALAPIPIVLFWHGPKIRKRSRFASGLIHASTGNNNGDEDNRACGIAKEAAEKMSYKEEAEVKRGNQPHSHVHSLKCVAMHEMKK